MIGQIRRFVWSSWRPIAERAARAYIAGPTFTDALRVCQALAQHGMATTVCPWDGEGEQPRQVADSYLAALEGLGRTALDCYLSIKAPSLGFSYDLLGELLEAARLNDACIHFDSLAPETAEQTWALIRQGAAHNTPVGCTLPARWHRSMSDVDRAVELGLRVRVVKGQWADPAAADLDMRKGFLAVVERLAGRARRVAVATHDSALARLALECLRGAGTACELELLFGLPARTSLRIARAVGVPVRFYVPYGHPWLPYCLSQARHNPRVLWWSVKDWLLGRRWPASPRSGKPA
jgi:proline dehydrogenase